MKSVFSIAVVLMGFSALAWAKFDPIMQAPELPPAWSPAQASDWVGANVQYAEAVQHYGENSLQAEKAKARMIRMSRILRADEVKPVEPVNLAGTNGTMAKPEVFDQWVPAPLSNTPEAQLPSKDTQSTPPQ